VVPSEGFWREFFLLPPAKGHLRQVLEHLTGDDILQLQVCGGDFKCNAILHTVPYRNKLRPCLPGLQERFEMVYHQETRMPLRLDQLFSVLAPLTYHIGQNLTAFLGGVLSKKYTNPSSDIISILAGLDKVDKLVSDLVNGIEELARNGDNSELMRHL
jgi:hypothetical protein